MSSSLEEILRMIEQDRNVSTNVKNSSSITVSLPPTDVQQTNPNLLKLQLYDGKILACPEDVLRCSTLMTTSLNNFRIADDSDPFVLLVPKCTEEVMRKLFEYCAQHRNDDPTRPQKLTPRERRDFKMSDWDQEFIEQMDRSMLVQLINAAYVLEIQGLIDIACKQMANMVRGKSTVEKCKILGIPCDIGKKELNRYEKEQSSFLRRMRRLKLIDEKTGDWAEPIHDLIEGKTDTATVGNIQITYRQQQISIQLPPVSGSSENGVIAAGESRPAISSPEHWSDVEERLLHALDEFLQ